MNKKLVPKLRFPEFKNSGEWEEKKLGEVLDYLQPTPYLINSIKYDDKFEIPVLTAGKSFILGYTNENEGIFKRELPVIIFDDFTTTSKFVDFEFKVKSSAIKILLAKQRNNIKFVYELINTIHYEVGTHKRHWISVFSKLKIPIPSIPEQKKIASCLSSIDDIITSQNKKLEALKQHKKALMQNLFPEEWETIPKLRFPEFKNDGEWEEKKLGEVLQVGNGKSYKHLSKGKIPVYGTGGYMVSVNDFLHNGESICIGRKGTIDKPMFLTGKFWTVDTLFFTHSFNNCLPQFIFSIFQKIKWQKYNAATGVPSLSKTTIEEIKILIPTIPEQKKIASCLSSLDDIVTSQNKKLEALKQHKKALMQNLFPEVD